MSAKEASGVAIFAILTSIGAYLRIPLFPVPITLQTLFTLLSGLVLGPSLGAISQIIYIIMGLIGIPVFSGSSGISVVLSPSFGYLIGFIPAAYLSGCFLKSKPQKGFGRFFTAALIGTAIIYLTGVPYLYFSLKYIMGKDIGLSNTLFYGCLVFLPGDIGKSLIAAFLATKLLPVLNRK